MPARNQTGPTGYGPMTGRGMGFCTGVNAPYPRYGNVAWGYGRRMGFGRRMGNGPFFYGAMPIQYLSSMDSLAAEKEMLKQRLDSIEKELEALSKEEK
ncbi:MAG: DUF5320 domain-containing protein [Candidatus Izemoplasmatales bacterium]|nr:DUF5320 domain-containing protein [Candidatus Izemoplasmatales bacterium]